MVDSMDLMVSNANAMTISHVLDATKSSSTIIPFSLEIANVYVPLLNEEEMMVVSRNKVDMIAHGPNDMASLEEVSGSGKMPRSPSVLPTGFKELKK